MVRICEMELSGFKNTRHGRIEMPSASNNAYFSAKSDILGIYGQNGSGKTAVIEALHFVQLLLTGCSLPADAEAYIAKGQERCRISVEFAVQVSQGQYRVTYTIELQRSGDGVIISLESLSARKWNGEKFEPQITLPTFSVEYEPGQFTPKYRYEDLIRSNAEHKINLGVAQKLAQKDCTSTTFSQEGLSIFLSAPVEVSGDYAEILQALHQYAMCNLFVIPNAHAGAISLNLLLPFTFRLESADTITKGDLPIRLDAPSVIDKERYTTAKSIIAQMNTVLGTLVQGLSIGVHDFGEQLLETGDVGYKIELISKRDDVTIPLKYESEGIIKIISILNVLMCVFSNPAMCLVVDELDSGIYEYLLGELLTVFEKSAKGQLIFTSHNLRALEMLNKSNIIFSTTNPDNRYIRLQNVKTNNNLRDMYLRSITLGGQREEIYAQTDTVAIARAFRRAGKAVQDGSAN